MRFETSCPFLMCLEPVPHEHPSCEICGAVRYGSMDCARCNEVRATNDNPVLENGRLVEGAVNMGGRGDER